MAKSYKKTKKMTVEEFLSNHFILEVDISPTKEEGSKNQVWRYLVTFKNNETKENTTVDVYYRRQMKVEDGIRRAARKIIMMEGLA